jgi:DNA-binding NtrC family response regulator
MDLLLWIGPRRGPAELKGLLNAQGLDLMAFESADAALRATTGLPVAAAFVVDWPGAPQAVKQLTASRPEVQILVATGAGVSRSLLQALHAGASTVLDFRTESKPEILTRVQEAVARHGQANRERSLLLRLRSLNEDFLKNVVALEKRNIQLEERLRSEAVELDAEELPARVLVVDDEEVVRNVVEAILSKKGYSFVSVADGEAALAEMERRPFDLVITDKNLPGMSGIDLLREVRRRDSGADLMLMTGYGTMDSAIDALNVGAAAYLTKPFDHVKTVMERIEAVLDERRERNRKRVYLHMIKDRNRAFLEQYRAIRADLEAWLQNRGVPIDSPTPVAPAVARDQSHG